MQSFNENFDELDYAILTDLKNIDINKKTYTGIEIIINIYLEHIKFDKNMLSDNNFDILLHDISNSKIKNIYNLYDSHKIYNRTIYRKPYKKIYKGPYRKICKKLTKTFL
jgi:hypothetical protein